MRLDRYRFPAAPRIQNHRLHERVKGLYIGFMWPFAIEENSAVDDDGLLRGFHCKKILDLSSEAVSSVVFAHWRRNIPHGQGWHESHQR